MIPALDRVLLEFVGGPSVLAESIVRQRISSAGIDAERVDGVIEQLVNLTFLGVEVSSGRFSYADERKELQKNLVLSARFAAAQGAEPRYEINSPFRAYLELQEAPEGSTLF
jgi:hypothetical protein